MKIATGIISIFLMFVIGLQSCAVSFGGALTSDKDISGAGSIGILVALLFLLAGAFAFKLPKVSMVIFCIAALFAFIAGASKFTDMKVWGVVSLILGVMSYFAGRKKKAKTEATETPAAQ